MNSTNIPFNCNRIAFDYDGTLSKPLYQLITHYLKTLGKNIFIITKRNEDTSNEVYMITDAIRIPREQVIFTDNHDKGQYILQNDIQAFYDDDANNLLEINNTAPDCETHLAI